LRFRQPVIDRVLAELFAELHGIEILSCELDDEQLTSLVLRREVRIVYLSRSNLLQAAMSDLIANVRITSIREQPS
jgi:hypothetical protein